MKNDIFAKQSRVEIMTIDEITQTLIQYKSALAGVKSRFFKTRDTIHIGDGDAPKFTQIVLELRDLFTDEFMDSRRYVEPLINAYNDSVSNYLGSPSYHGVESVETVVSAAIARVKRNPSAIKTVSIFLPPTSFGDPEFLAKLWQRFPLAVRQIRRRFNERPTLDVADEYDVQDLFHVILTTAFDDIRKEEWSPSYAGSSSRMDFLLPEIEAVAEIKMMRNSLSTKSLGEQLIVDIVKYKKHPQCRTLYCLVYDPESRIANPRGVESDLNDDESDMRVRVIIVPS